MSEYADILPITIGELCSRISTTAVDGMMLKIAHALQQLHYMPPEFAMHKLYEEDEPHCDLLEAMLSPDPEERLQSCGELIERLESMIGKSGAEEIRECDLPDEDDDEELASESEVELKTPSLKEAFAKLIAEDGKISDAGLEVAYDKLRVELTARIKEIMAGAMEKLSRWGRPSDENE